MKTLFSWIFFLHSICISLHSFPITHSFSLYLTRRERERQPDAATVYHWIFFLTKLAFDSEEEKEKWWWRGRTRRRRCNEMCKSEYTRDSSCFLVWTHSHIFQVNCRLSVMMNWIWAKCFSCTLLSGVFADAISVWDTLSMRIVQSVTSKWENERWESDSVMLKFDRDTDTI